VSSRSGTAAATAVPQLLGRHGAAWYDEITNRCRPRGAVHELLWRDGFYHNSWSSGTGYVRDSDFTDTNVVGWGRDH